MDFSVGDEVVFGESGATTVRAITTREVAGRTWTRVVLGFPFDSAEPDTIVEPLVDHQSLAPLSQVLGTGGVPAVLAVLRSPVPEQEPRNWGTVWETYYTKLGGITADAGRDEMPAVLDARQVAEVVRNLTAKRHRQELDASDTQLLDQARTVLVSEVALGAGIDRRQAEAAIDEALTAHGPES
jgi:RNA polymerase-interacting CarD/CdnL/TRCF family regulator